MEATVTANDLRHRFPEMVRRVQQGETLIATSRSRPVFRIVPMQQAVSDVAWLDRVHAVMGPAPSMYQINRIVHQVRREKNRFQ